MKVHILGAKGYIGSLVCDFLQANSSLEVIGIHRDKTADNNEFLHCISSPGEYQLFLKNSVPDVAIIAIGSPSVDWSEKFPTESYIKNYLEPRSYIEEILSANPLAKIIHISSIYVFGKQSPLDGFDESSQALPTSKYGQDKYRLEKFLSSVTENFVITRLPFVVGNFSHQNDFFNQLQVGNQVNFSNSLRFPVNAFGIAFFIFLSILKDLRGIFHIPGCEGISKYEMAKKYFMFLKPEEMDSIKCIDDAKSSEWIRPEYLKLKSNYFNDDFLKVFDWQIVLPIYRKISLSQKKGFLKFFCEKFFQKYSYLK